MFVGLFAVAGRAEPDLLAAVLRMARTTLLGGALIVAAAFVDSGLRPLLWLAAVAVGFVGPILVGVRGWRVHLAHFAERHGLILIIALGEALVAIGLGARSTRLGGEVIVAAVLGVLIAASFWLAYFDFFSIGVERLLMDHRGEQRVTLARDAYTYLHLPMVAGIVLFAFAMRTTLAHVHADLHVIPALALCGGSALYLLAYVALRWRVSHIPEPRPHDCVAWVRGCVAGRSGCAGAGHSRAGSGGLGLAARLRAHLVARSPRRAARAMRTRVS